jgi:hypothetical protein
MYIRNQSPLPDIKEGLEYDKNVEMVLKGVRRQ